MTTKPSSAPWADEPFHLITTPSTYLMDSHSYVHISSEMAHAHNVLIRGLNSILQQAPYVPTSTEKNYNAQDVKDLLFYVKSWTKTTSHHHWLEESFIFPEIEKFSGKPGLLDGPKNQHELFHGGIERLLAYASTTTPEEYRWEGVGGMKEIIDSFSKHLTDHLYAEIDVCLGMKALDSAGLKKTWDQAEKVAQQSGNLGLLYDIFPCVLGTADKTYEGGNPFPPFPWFIPYLVKYWFAAGNGCWRFNPCDWWGKPQPLAFIPQKL
ncbi:uncharacterized protein GGS22DRAFT_169896 [Annulohypoxylon maeteangense]|uniref:uncharacterized protein n=1 Tax=Annulohypoxylon maeteangense TaxID=1927788 RepID=UPI00200821EB|nr:uncharacterized protein GGS22DRAFT_169896 [Annulohypoxylon maeteangense]KAI0882619.1 hypothetical protein GGS22DRAFT_169896 [Annulohypoxylon maeteangense]